MKKIIYTLVFCTSVSLGLASFASAQTVPIESGTFGVSLEYGSTNTAEVLKLQQFLYDNGYLRVAPTGQFLSLTRAAVIQFQTEQGILPNLGYFGPITRSAVEKSTLAKGNASSAKNGATVTAMSIGRGNSNTALAIMSDPNARTVIWRTNNYPAGVGVDINLIQLVSGFPRSFALVRVLATNTANDGVEQWTAVNSAEIGNDMYVEVTCSGAFTFTSGCFANDPIKVN